MAVATVTTAAAAADAPSAESVFPASVKLETENYLVEIAAAGPFKVGVEGSAKVTLTTKGVYHINAQYPYRFKAAAPPNGLSYPKPVLQRADGQFEEKRAVFNLAFVASQAGKFNVGGVFHMSVCSSDSCLVEKAPLDVTVSVK
ncbi:MAG TPA: hypothetical protein VJN18_25795 [Polyangiaceae bacterium]|nr:hypothetical protein [Polyangiaceae bacterium]